MSACRTFIVAALLALPACSLKLSGLPDYSDPCPFGYGTGCSTGSGKIDPATKDQVAHILEGILNKLSSHKALVQDKKVVAKVDLAAHATSKATTASKATATALKSLLEKLQNTKQAAAGKALQTLLEAVPDVGCTYFGACGASSDHPIDDATKAQVAKILEGILGNLQSHNH